MRLPSPVLLCMLSTGLTVAIAVIPSLALVAIITSVAREENAEVLTRLVTTFTPEELLL